MLPSLAVAEALRRRGVTVTFAGAQRAEATLVPKASFPLDGFAVEGIPRRIGLSAIRAVGRAAGAVPAALRIVRRRRPDVVLGGGGYVAGPVALAAASLRIPVALMEADAHLGLANRLAAPVARRVFLAFPIDGRDGPKYRVVGRPIPERSRPVSRAAARERFGLLAAELVVLAVGGSQGARALNEAAIEAWADEGPAVLHLCGAAHVDALRRRVSRPDYVVLGFTDDFGAALGAADLVVARAGGSVWEVAAAAKPALLVPYPHATADHQTKNARFFEQGGGAVVVPEDELDLGRQAGELLADPVRLAAMAEAMRRLARPDAADVVAEEMLALARA
ncbi:MAG: UDP-N-acetylglucosamine--N-acetylmuramyl-(pentapeptide) pyrophosphoryl-undecaprenol N-acetylglucosamine transferase [Actinomycetota bacterium]|nr:UDP-N-acetylglucosamine--N-acetylmuramyl-(pentapeptide) pyrophosphoryl-undecaprenol N-acetylglucosamine transferase [Actinomycetota bacterium]